MSASTDTGANGIPKLGETASRSMTVTEAEIRAFADAVGDRNPLHLDPQFASRTRFGRPIAHGMLAASLISAVLGTQLPGPGTIYLRQTLEFKEPVYPGDVLTATVTVIRIREDKPVVTLRTVCTKADGTVAVDGEAVVLFDNLRGR